MTDQVDRSDRARGKALRTAMASVALPSPCCLSGSGWLGLHLCALTSMCALGGTSSRPDQTQHRTAPAVGVIRGDLSPSACVNATGRYSLISRLAARPSPPNRARVPGSEIPHMGSRGTARPRPNLSSSRVGEGDRPSPVRRSSALKAAVWQAAEPRQSGRRLSA